MIPTKHTGFFIPQDDRSLQKNLPQFVENFDHFQSSRDGRSFKNQKREKYLKVERLTLNQIQSMEKQALIRHIFRSNYRQVDRFFRKEYLRELSERTEGELRELIQQTIEHELLLIQ
ncbi:MAG: hypothetical protein ACTSVZ_06060 [Promethearchaeota archaeon]